MTSRWEIALNLLFWLLSSWLITSSFSIASLELENINGVETVRVVRDYSLIRQLLACVGLSVLLFYANLWLLLRAQPQPGRPKAALFSPMLLLLAIGLFVLLKIPDIYGAGLPLPNSLGIGLLSFYYAVSIAYGAGRAWLKADRQGRQMALDKKQAELNLLRNQLHPHFLFNALNNLLAMADQAKNPKFATALDTLSGLLRYVVYDVSESKVPVYKEIQFIRDFAGLQQLRFEPGELRFVLQCIGRYDQQAIEPGIFIPFIENAFKYGAEPETVSEIRVLFDLTQPDIIRFTVHNPIHPALQKQPGKGSGIQASRARLALVYPGRHWLAISQQAGFEVKLEIHTHESDNR